ncbi:MAG TPA: helix-turn-helix transcriptional regulator [Thermoanaerobaculia bacterium]|nr:helix-turn-helix transcriptional regulator [Thermoanaerobaculia bacterium]
MNIPRAIKTCRLARRMSQSELAERTNLSAAYISLIESGKKQPTIPTLDAIAEAFELSLDVLMLTAIDYEQVRRSQKAVSDLFGQMLLALVPDMNEAR